MGAAMLRLVLSVCAIAMVSGCMQGAAPSAKSPSDPTGPAYLVKPGMTQFETASILGIDMGFERNPDNWDEACYSYNYATDEAIKFVHVRFVNDALTSATDGHLDLCTYDAAVE